MSGHEVFRYESRSIRLAFSGGELKTKESDSSAGFAVRALEGGRLGFGHCQHESGVEGALAQARQMSRFSVKSGFSFAPASTFAKPAIHDPSSSPDDVESMRSLVDEAKDMASSKGGNPRVMASMEDARVSVENTAGFSGAFKKTVFTLYVESMHGDGYGFSFLASHRRPKDAAVHGLLAAEMAQAMQNAGKPESGSYTVVMEPEALESLVDTLLPSLSGDWKRRGITALAEGKKRFSDMLTICDDGLSEGINARPFDDEGTPSQKRALIERGEVKSFLYDRETSALEGGSVKESGSCSRESYDSAPSIGASNIVISPGGMEDLGELDRFIEVRSAHGSHTANLTTGDIGLEVSTAFLVEKGRRRPIKGFMLSGNVFDMFANIEAMEKKQRVFGSLVAPRIAFGNVRVVS
ncbi:TldD/PmbA family protein [Candidatus Micrarchaeota archaeon]|nr:TldD/PmbA family protein [Candidatus Micrarchaeota archaeon]